MDEENFALWDRLLVQQSVDRMVIAALIGGLSRQNPAAATAVEEALAACRERLEAALHSPQDADTAPRKTLEQAFGHFEKWEHAIESAMR